LQVLILTFHSCKSYDFNFHLLSNETQLMVHLNRSSVRLMYIPQVWVIIDFETTVKSTNP